MQTSLFDFALPTDLIALRPVEPRDMARLLVVDPDGRLEHGRVLGLGDYMQKYLVF
jgi:S-adenosylmethionine:tRNA ribosyltransferase-isomerase